MKALVSVERSVTDTDIESLRGEFRGELLRPGDDGYDDARRVWNSMIQKYPALIARCTGTADVIAAVSFAREHDLFLAVRGGGHNVAGIAVCDEGVVIDLSRMRGISVDPGRRVVRVQAGANWGDLDHETQVHGLIVPGGVVSTTGVAGFTLSGGMSATRRKWGMTCDHLISAEIVTATGEVLTASESSHPDLFWALKGGGGNFGVVTEFEFALRSLGPQVYLAAPIYSLGDAGEIVRQWRTFMENAPDEISSDLIFWSMPPLPGVDESVVGSPIVILAAWYAGPVGDGERALQPLREFGTPLADLSHAGRYVDIQSSFDVFFPDTQRYYWKSLFVDSLTDETIDRVIGFAAERPSLQSLMVLRALGGEIARVPEAATAYGNRSAGYNLSFDTTWQDEETDEQMVSWTRNAWLAMRDLTGGGVYLNFAGLGEDGQTLVRAAYGENYERLVRVKRQYDPGNLFRGNVNIEP